MFWFVEYRKYVTLLRAGKSIDTIKALASTENVFSASTPMRGRQIFSTVSARANGIPDSYNALFEHSAIETQKLIVLISIMNTDSLFLDFMNEVFREKMITGDILLTDSDVRVFFLNKQRESDKVAKWKDETLTRLGGCYKTYLVEAGLLERGVGSRKLTKPLLDSNLETLLRETRMNHILKILLGTR